MEVFIPDKTEEAFALSRTTHLALAAHHDDIEIMAYDGVLKCFGNPQNHFTGVVVANGEGSPRSGIYANYTDGQMKSVRKTEQMKAATVGDYSAQVFLDYPSNVIKDKNDKKVIADMKEILKKTQPRYIYTHNIADKHDTHIGVAVKVITSLRELGYTPEGLYGCEVWRGLDWLCDSDKIRFDVSSRPNLENAVLSVFDSQISGGKRYDLAAVGRRLANATFSESHGVDASSSVIFAMDLLPLLDKDMDIAEFAAAHIQKFAQDVQNKINAVTP